MIFLQRAFFCLGLVLIAPLPVQAQPLDLVMVLDNSRTMRKNDPARLTSRLVEGLWMDLADARMAVVTFTDKAETALKFTPVGKTRQDALLQVQKSMDSGGRWSNLQAGVELAIYMLRMEARTGADKAIILVTGGTLDTGNLRKDQESTRWLSEELALDAAERNIRIFGVGVSPETDFRLLQSLARKTKAEYYRMLAVEDFDQTFKHLSTQFQAPAKPAVREQVAPSPMPQGELVPVQVVQPPVRMTPPPAPPQVDEAVISTQRVLPLMLMAAGGVLGMGLLLMVLVQRKKAGELTLHRNPQDHALPLAMLKDLNRVSGRDMLTIDQHTMTVGRSLNAQLPPGQQIILPDPNVSRSHAVLQYRDQAFFIKDNGSANGTWVNERRVTDWHRINHADMLRFGSCRVQLLVPPASPSEQTMTAPSPDETSVRAGVDEVIDLVDPVSESVLELRDELVVADELLDLSYPVAEPRQEKPVEEGELLGSDTLMNILLSQTDMPDQADLLESTVLVSPPRVDVETSSILTPEQDEEIVDLLLQEEPAPADRHEEGEPTILLK